MDLFRDQDQVPKNGPRICDHMTRSLPSGPRHFGPYCGPESGPEFWAPLPAQNTSPREGLGCALLRSEGLVDVGGFRGPQPIELLASAVCFLRSRGPLDLGGPREGLPASLALVFGCCFCDRGAPWIWAAAGGPQPIVLLLSDACVFALAGLCGHGRPPGAPSQSCFWRRPCVFALAEPSRLRRRPVGPPICRTPSAALRSSFAERCGSRRLPRILLKGPGVLFKDPGVLLKDPGVLLKGPGVLLKDPWVLLKVPGVLLKDSGDLLKDPGVL